MGVERALVFLAALAIGAAIPAQGTERIDPDGVPGALVIVGGGGMPDDARAQFVALAGGENARIVVIPTASSRADQVETDDGWSPWLEPWSGVAGAAVVVVHPSAAPPSETDAARLRAATGVWFSGGDQNRLADRLLGNAWEDLIGDVLRRGGVVGGTSAGAAIQSRVMIAGGRDEPRIRAGLDLLPGAIVDQHFKARERLGRLERAVAAHPDRFGIGVDEGTALIVRGRRVDVIGASTATVVLAASARRPARVFELQPGDRADLTALRRMARNRATLGFPGPEPRRPDVRNGALVIVGGGGLPEAVTARFVELAGGPDAKIVMLPTAAPGSERSMRGLADRFLAAGATRVDILPQRTYEEVTADDFLALLRDATGVWFGGGRQWRFVDAYRDTPAEPALRAVLDRGGVIGGSSAGASIQGEYMPRGNPLGNTDVMAEGYERGFGYLGGVAIDQHLTQRGRLPDLVDLVRTLPAFLGVGIDERTALIVRGTVGRVLGAGSVHFVHAKPDAGDTDAPQVDRRAAGAAYDLVERR